MEENKNININQKNDKIVEFNQAKEEKKKEKKEVIRLEDILNQDGASSFEDIVSIISLPDEEFYILKEAILSELENAIEDSNNLILLKKEMETYGLTQDELVNQYADMMMALDQVKEIPKDRIDFLKRYIGIITNAFTEGQKASKRIIEIPIQLIGDAVKPKYSRIGDAGIDIRATEDYEIKPGETKLIKTGIKMAIPKGFEIQVRPRSGLSLKTKMRVANAPGTIDSNYRGELCIIIDNIEPKIKDITYTFKDNKDDPSHPNIEINSIEHGESFFISKNERIAQLVLSEIPTAHFYEVEDIGIFDSERGEDGFGSSGKE